MEDDEDGHFYSRPYIAFGCDSNIIDGKIILVNIIRSCPNVNSTENIVIRFTNNF